MLEIKIKSKQLMPCKIKNKNLKLGKIYPKKFTKKKIENQRNRSVMP